MKRPAAGAVCRFFHPSEKEEEGSVGAIHELPLPIFSGKFLQGLEDKPFSQRNFIFIIP